MNKIQPKVSNPLTLITVFSGLAEIAATVVLTQLTGNVQAQFVWFWKPDGTNINRANEAQLKAWMSKKNINVSITNFLNADRFEAQSSEIVRDLNI